MTPRPIAPWASVFALVGCGARTELPLADPDGGSGGGTPTDARIFVADVKAAGRESDRIVAFHDLRGTGFTTVDPKPSVTYDFPCSPTFDEQGRLVFVERYFTEVQGRIVRMNLETDEVETSTAQNGTPYANIALDGRGGFYVTDWEAHLLYFSSLEAEPVMFGEAGDGVGQFERPFGVAVRPDGKVIVVDGPNRRVIQIDDITGAGWTEWHAELPSVPDVPEELTDVAVDGAGRMYIGDVRHALHRIDDISGANHVVLDLEDAGFPVTDGVWGVSVSSAGRIFITLGTTDGMALAAMDDMTGAGREIYLGEAREPFTFLCGGPALR